MIVIRTIEELEYERKRQLEEWIDAGKDEDEFYVSLEEADLEGAKLSGVNLKEVDLEGAVINSANLTGANLQ